MSSLLPQFTTDEISPSPRPAPLLSPNESASTPSSASSTRLRSIDLELLAFLSTSLCIAFSPTATVVLFYWLAQGEIPYWTCFIIYLWISGILFVFGSTAEALAYVTYLILSFFMSTFTMGGQILFALLMSWPLLGIMNYIKVIGGLTFGFFVLAYLMDLVMALKHALSIEQVSGQTEEVEDGYFMNEYYTFTVINAIRVFRVLRAGSCSDSV
ncbi:uncharacterized protein GGS22DRAFT_190554 [Annulohypoxylon maeteangense]|uniref:uncharacterized protein n=1 Tax=Annulohypoxylon maeteangense TaxID=1927788 RepID=UPI0020079FA5|nr:uncharacterized protein GGS22DRAFT_190554 [Annulohypoxylon maeteangense]KAI0883241.1 hypothetical protein GGS22DRAFT_190554 [Annulohypoxylon maeteangense]